MMDATTKIGIFLTTATFGLLVVIISLVVMSKNENKERSTIATREELVKNGLLPKDPPKRTKQHQGVTPEAVPELSREAKEAIQNKKLLQESNDNIRRLEANPYHTIMNNERTQNASIDFLKEEATRLRIEIQLLRKELDQVKVHSH